MFQQARQLLDLITKSIDTIEKICIESKTQPPSLDEPFDWVHRAFWADPAVEEAVAVIIASTSHLNAIVLSPVDVMRTVVNGFWEAAAMRVCLESSVTEILREAGPGGLHVDHIAAKNGIDAPKLARCLRLMATHHIYREVMPDVFTNNRVSSLLDTLKPSSEIIADPYHKYDDTFGLVALYGHLLDDTFKASAYLWETASDPKTATSGGPTETSFSRAFGNGEAFWDFIGQPDNAFKRRRFDIGMRGTQVFVTNAPVIAAYDWKSLPAEAVVVDVGGGVGTASLSLAKEFPHLKFIVQDQQPVVDAGVEVWKKELPDAILSGRVQFEGHDFLTTQPQTDASIFFLKNILHDWSDKYSSKILKHLRDAATCSTKLVIVEIILPYTCHEVGDNTDGITSAVSLKAPSPLLPNWGAANGTAYFMDLVMLTVFNGQERTIQQFDQLLKSAGWKITAVRRQHGVSAALLSSIEAVPV